MSNIKFLSKLFQKKFKVRISHFSGCSYTVDYTYHRFIPKWKSLQSWQDRDFNSESECWNLKLFEGAATAECFASTIKTICDIRNYYKPQEEKEIEFYVAKYNYYRKDVPFKHKVIIS